MYEKQNHDEAERIRVELASKRCAELPEDWNVWQISEEDCASRDMPRECAGWAVSRDHGSLVVGIGYVSRAQALNVARRVLADD